MEKRKYQISSRTIVCKDNITKRSLSAYRIFNRNDGKSLVFYPVPKNANSSFKELFSRLCGISEKFVFFDDKAPMSDSVTYSQKGKDKEWLWGFLPPKPLFVNLPEHVANIKLAVYRDPVERFFSAYKNRILWHRDKQFYGLSVEEVVEKLLAGKFDNLHFLPQSYFLGSDPDYFTYLANVADLDGMVEYICDFFGEKLSLNRLQVRHGELDESECRNTQLLNNIKKIYLSDYQFIERINGNLV